MRERHVAILIDGGFFLKRLPKLLPSDRLDTPELLAQCLRNLCKAHIQYLTAATDRNWQRALYRIFYYDAMPFDGKVHHPIDNRPIDYAKTQVARDRLAFFGILKRQRKLALRLGKVSREQGWIFLPAQTKSILRAKRLVDSLDIEAIENNTLDAEQLKLLNELKDAWASLDSGSIQLGLRQKGVDMRLGLDISTLALKGQVDTMVLVTGDSDFVPAAKLARREGGEVVLDPLWQKVNSDLFEHIDGLHSGIPRPLACSDFDG